MIEVLVSFKPEPFGFVRGYITVYDETGNIELNDENMYTNIYQFILYIFKKYINKKYKWVSIKVNCKKGVLQMKGTEVTGFKV